MTRIRNLQRIGTHLKFMYVGWLVETEHIVLIPIHQLHIEAIPDTKNITFYTSTPQGAYSHNCSNESEFEEFVTKITKLAEYTELK